MPDANARLRAAALALLVTFLWSTSWVLIKHGLDDLPPITFAGIRYGLAALILVTWTSTVRGEGCCATSIGHRSGRSLASAR